MRLLETATCCKDIVCYGYPRATYNPQSTHPSRLRHIAAVQPAYMRIVLEVTRIPVAKAHRTTRPKRATGAPPAAAGGADAFTLIARATGDHAGEKRPLFCIPTPWLLHAAFSNIVEHAGVKMSLIPHTRTVVSKVQAAKEL